MSPGKNKTVVNTTRSLRFDSSHGVTEEDQIPTSSELAVVQAEVERLKNILESMEREADQERRVVPLGFVRLLVRVVLYPKRLLLGRRLLLQCYHRSKMEPHSS